MKKTSVRYSTIPTVRKRQRAIEREVLAHMKRKALIEWAPSVPRAKREVSMYLMSVAWWNALTRLRAKGLVKPGRHAYVITAAGWRSR